MKTFIVKSDAGKFVGCFKTLEEAMKKAQELNKDLSPIFDDMYGVYEEIINSSNK